MPGFRTHKSHSMAHRIAVFPAGIAGVSLHRVYDTVFHLLHDPNVIRDAILPHPLVIPIKEDQVAGMWLIVTILPLSPRLEPLDTHSAAREFGDHATFQIAALVGAP